MLFHYIPGTVIESVVIVSVVMVSVVMISVVMVSVVPITPTTAAPLIKVNAQRQTRDAKYIFRNKYIFENLA